jgi:hypothetical protein
LHSLPEHPLRLLKQNLHHYTRLPDDENNVQTMVIIHPNSVSSSERQSDLKQTLISLPNPLVQIPSRYTNFTCIPEALLNSDITLLPLLQFTCAQTHRHRFSRPCTVRS